MWEWSLSFLCCTLLVLTVCSPVAFDTNPFPIQKNTGQSPNDSLLRVQRAVKNKYEYRDRLSTSLLYLEVVLILPDDSKRSLGLSRTLAKTLNSVTAADLVSQLDFPEKNLTWTVRNYVFGRPQQPSSSSSSSSSWRSRQGQDDNESDSDDSSSSYGNEDFKESSFSPQLLSHLCHTLSDSKAIAMVTLLSDPGSEKLLSLVSTTTGIPLIASAHSLTNPLFKDVDDMYINLSESVRDLARSTAHLLLHCHWHSFTFLSDDSLAILQARPVWKEEFSTSFSLPSSSSRFPPNNETIPSSSSSSSTPEYSSYYTDYEESLLGESSEQKEDDITSYSSNSGSPRTLLRPKWVTIQTRSPNSPFRALSELTKATQGIIVLLLSQRSAVQVFQAAKQLRMLNGDYVFILVGQYAQFERVPDWIPQGVLGLRAPKLPLHVDKARMRATGSLLASALTSIKDAVLLGEKRRSSSSSSSSSISNSASSPFNSKKSDGPGGVSVGGVFSGFTNKDFLSNSNSPTKARAEETESQTSPVLVSTPTEGTNSETVLDVLEKLSNLSCFHQPHGFRQRQQISLALTREMRAEIRRTQVTNGPTVIHDIVNLVRSPDGKVGWLPVGTVSPESAHVTLQTIRWPGGGLFGPGERPSKSYRIVTIIAPPFVMESQAEDNKTCTRGLPCLRVNTKNKDQLAIIFADFEGRARRMENGEYSLTCCDGLAMDLLGSIARELKFKIDLFLVPDGYFGSRNSDGSWNGLMGTLMSGGAHAVFAPISVTSIRATAVDFATPFFFSGVGLLGISKERDVPMFAFLAPFSTELWAAIFITLNLTALVVAVYEWFSPFGLNPWGRQRTKNFSISSALWVVWGRLFSHLVAFKAPKSWPNKFLINVWGGFSVIFVASYTANIAALFAGMFFEKHVDVNDRSLLSQRVTAVKHSATDFYIKREYPHLWEHIQQYPPVKTFQEGVNMLKNGSLDLLIGDGPLLDYYRGTDASCNLVDISDHDKIGDDTYAVAMSRGFPLKNGYLDYLQGKWYGQMHCFTRNQQQGARALGVDAVHGMLIMLGIAFFLGIIILIMELVIFKHALPYCRSQPKGTLWRSPNVMFFSQKLYRFINCVELVSPHHAAKELANTLRQGQITSLFQKSVKRKEHEQRRRRKSKAQFYEMIQEIKRVQMAEKHHNRHKRPGDTESGSTVYSIQPPKLSDPRRIPMELDDDPCPPPRMCRGHLPGEEILIAEFPRSRSSRSSFINTNPGASTGGLLQEDPPSTTASASSDYLSGPRRIQWTSRHLVAPSGSGSVASQGSISSHPNPPHGILRKPPPPEEETEEEEGAELSEEDSYELYSPLDKADLVGLNKSQIIEMWRASELDLRRQLSQALKAKDQLTSQLNSRSQTPAMLVEFDQVKI